MISSTEFPAMQSHASAAPSGEVLRSFVIGLTAFLTVVDLFATQAILPSLAKAYQVTPAAIGFAVNASTIGMAVAGLDRRILQQPHRPTPRHPREPGAAVDPDCAACRCTRSHNVHAAAHRAGPLHVDSFCLDAFLSRRALQRDEYSQRLCRIYHRQCRQQPVRPPDVGRVHRSSGAGRPISIFSPRSTSPAPFSSISRWARRRRCHRWPRPHARRSHTGSSICATHPCAPVSASAF